ncbi:hypothetical protein [Collimonas sp. OK242]|jgi:hypothetical protein|uniref:hypothetical protein n=1 Tax=Collimonas sp. OK242 TaxID=1798195 RepID=UPI000B846A56|nr:hypothetical protein [Collimonas sp. OK242]
MVCGLHHSKACSKTSAMFIDRQMITLTSQIASDKRTRIQPADMASQPTTGSWQEKDFFIGIGGSFS